MASSCRQTHGPAKSKMINANLTEEIHAFAVKIDAMTNLQGVVAVQVISIALAMKTDAIPNLRHAVPMYCANRTCAWSLTHLAMEEASSLPLLRERTFLRTRLPLWQ
jgi:hypothetical protein